MTLEERTLVLTDINSIIKRGLVPACEPLLADGRYEGSTIRVIDPQVIDSGLRQRSPTNAVAYTLGQIIYKKGTIFGKEMMAFYVPVQFWAEKT